MRILVSIKRVIDSATIVRVNDDDTGVKIDNVKMSINPFCENALEQAIQMKENGIANEVIVVTVGSLDSKDILYMAYAKGADRAILVENNNVSEPLSVAKILKKVVEDETPDLVLMGRQGIDNDNSHTPQMLSALLGWSQLISVSKMKVDGNKIVAETSVSNGIQTLSATMPCVISASLSLNEPRYASLPKIMKAKRKKIERINIEVEQKNHMTILKVERPIARPAGVRVQNVSELVAILKEKEVL